MKMKRDTDKFIPFIFTIENEEEFMALWAIADNDVETKEMRNFRIKLSNMISFYDHITNEEISIDLKNENI